MTNFVIKMRYIYFILLLLSLTGLLIGVYKAGELKRDQANQPLPTSYIVLIVVTAIFSSGFLIVMLTSSDCNILDSPPPIPYSPPVSIHEPEINRENLIEKYGPMLMEHGPEILKEINPSWSKKLSKLTKGLL